MYELNYVIAEGYERYCVRYDCISILWDHMENNIMS